MYVYVIYGSFGIYDIRVICMGAHITIYGVCLCVREREISMWQNVNNLCLGERYI